METQPTQAHHRAELPYSREAPSAARGEFRCFAPDLSERTLDDALVMVSELVTNAVQHGMPAVTLELWRTISCITVVVLDRGDGPLALIRPAPPGDHPHGRGLMIVNALAARWGVGGIEGEAGKLVWFDLDCGPIPA